MTAAIKGHNGSRRPSVLSLTKVNIVVCLSEASDSAELHVHVQCESVALINSPPHPDDNEALRSKMRVFV